jgi:hypothetical protein
VVQCTVEFSATNVVHALYACITVDRLLREAYLKV